MKITLIIYIPRGIHMVASRHGPVLTGISVDRPVRLHLKEEKLIRPHPYPGTDD